MIKSTSNILLMTFLISLYSMSCSSDENPAKSGNDMGLVGSWTIIELSWSAPLDTGAYSKTQLESVGFVWQLTFNSDNTGVQMTNIDGPTISQELNWTTTADNLTLKLKEPYSGSIDFNYKITSNILTLIWTRATETEYNADFTKL